MIKFDLTMISQVCFYILVYFYNLQIHIGYKPSPLCLPTSVFRPRSIYKKKSHAHKINKIKEINIIYFFVKNNHIVIANSQNSHE